MRVLVLGSGAKEHAITWKFSESHRISGLYIAPGNAGTDELGENLPGVNPSDPQQVLAACRELNIDYVFCAIERAIQNGVVDALQEEGIACFGAPKRTGFLDSDKQLSREFMKRHAIPSTAGQHIRSSEELASALQSSEGRMVIRKNGLSRPRTVFESCDKAKLLEYGENLLKEDSIILESCCKGLDLSVFALSDGEHYRILPYCSDYKRAEENDKGPTTNGMGAIAPVPGIAPATRDTIEKQIIAPTFEGLKEEGLSYKGVLFFGIILSSEGPKLFEYHLRFGDPEAQVVLSLLQSDFGNLVEALQEGTIDQFPLHYSSDSALGVVIASQNYPDYSGDEVSLKPIPSFPETDTLIFHGATKLSESRKVISSTGRCFTVVGIDKNLVRANTRAYEAAKRISFEGAKYRTDIGNAFFEE